MYIVLNLLTPLVWAFFVYQPNLYSTAAIPSDDTYLVHISDPNTLHFYWKDDTGKIFSTFQRLNQHLTHQQKQLVFAMNGGMFTSQYAPQGLYIEQGNTWHTLDTASRGYGNFYMQPNGVFYLTTTHEAGICTTQSFADHKQVSFATQSGPMLLTDGRKNPAFMPNSSNLNIRNGVGILPNGKVLFVLSKKKINFYDFASFFQKAGCKNALYLDGVVSRAYDPAQKWIQTDGSFGVLIAEID